jgi:PleD family two-component response regulator
MRALSRQTLVHTPDGVAQRMNEHENKAVPAVLIVEDDQIIATLLEHLLKRRGFVTHWASDGQQALTFLDTLPPPALMLLDIMLQFFGRIRIDSAHPQHCGLGEHTHHHADLKGARTECRAGA